MSAPVRKFKETVDIQTHAFHRLRNRKYFPAAMLILAFLAVACFHVWQRVHVMSLVSEVAVSREENRELIDLTRKTHSEIAALSMNSRIEQFAHDSLGLSLVSADRLLTLQRPESAPRKQDRLELILTSLENVSKYLPTLSGNPVNAAEPSSVRFDSVRVGGEQ